MAQTTEFRDWCAFLQKKTHSGQAWNRKHINRWQGYLKRIGLKKMISLVEDVEFSNTDYALRILETYEIRKQEGEWEKLKAEMLLEASLTRGKGIKTGFNPEDELRRIQRETGNPRGPEAQEFARKWGLEL